MTGAALWTFIEDRRGAPVLHQTRFRRRSRCPTPGDARETHFFREYAISIILNVFPSGAGPYISDVW